MVKADLSHEDFKRSSNFEFTSGTSRGHKGSNEECGPSSLASESSCLSSDLNQDGHHLAAFEGISPGEQASAGRGQLGSDSVDVLAGSQQGTDRFRTSQKGSFVHRGVQGSCLDGLVCGPLREIGEGGSSQIRAICGVNSECRDQRGPEDQEEVPGSDDPKDQDDGHKVESSSQGCSPQVRRDSFLDRSGARGRIGS